MIKKDINVNQHDHNVILELRNKLYEVIDHLNEEKEPIEIMNPACNTPIEEK